MAEKTKKKTKKNSKKARKRSRVPLSRRFKNPKKKQPIEEQELPRFIAPPMEEMDDMHPFGAYPEESRELDEAFIEDMKTDEEREKEKEDRKKGIRRDSEGEIIEIDLASGGMIQKNYAKGGGVRKAKFIDS